MFLAQIDNKRVNDDPYHPAYILKEHKTVTTLNQAEHISFRERTSLTNRGYMWIEGLTGRLRRPHCQAAPSD